MSIILGLLIICVGSVLILAANKPDEFRVTRSIIINAAPAAIFPYLINLKKGQEWSPWVKMDPAADYMFDGPEEGVGAAVSWNGKKTGQGTQTVIETTPDKHVVFALEFFKPMQSKSKAEFTLTPEGDATKVEWAMHGPASFKAKLADLIMNCDKMCGTQFEIGLADLKTLVETGATPAAVDSGDVKTEGAAA